MKLPNTPHTPETLAACRALATCLDTLTPHYQAELQTAKTAHANARTTNPELLSALKKLAEIIEKIETGGKNYV